MSNPDPMPEPSMEEILASIRQIISEGDEDGDAKDPGDRAADAPAAAAETRPDAEPPVPPAPAPASRKDEDEDDVFDLTDDMMSAPVAPEPIPFKPNGAAAAPAAAPSFDDELEFRSAPERDSARGSDAEPDGPEPAAESPRRPEPQPTPAAAARPEGVASPAGSSADALLSAATGQAVAEAFGRLTQRSPSSEGRTIEELVVDMLRPMLKDWLDDNLPILVERLVRDEIERVARGRR